MTITRSRELTNLGYTYAENMGIYDITKLTCMSSGSVTRDLNTTTQPNHAQQSTAEYMKVNHAENIEQLITN